MSLQAVTKPGSTGGASSVPREFRRIGEDRYFMRLVGIPIEFDVEHVRRERGELIGELYVRTELYGARVFAGILSAGTFNVSSPTRRQALAKVLADAARTSREQIDWTFLLEEFCIRVLEAERAGASAVNLRDVPLRDGDDHHNIDGLILHKRQAGMLFADASSAKSLLALVAAGRLAERGERVGFFDFELDAPDQKVRYHRLFGDSGPDITYVRCSRPLVYEADRLRRIIAEQQITYGFIDSAAFASGGKPEDAEQTLGFFRVLRSFGIGTLTLAHVPKSAEAGVERPFGSQFWFAGVRSLWFGAAQATTPDGQRLVVALYHRKNNLGRLYPAVGFQFDFEPDRTVVSPCSISDVRELAERLPLWQRMKAALNTTPKTLVALADELSASVETLDRTVRRKTLLFTKVSGQDGVTRIALVERRAS
jgi:hypothetical protein